MDVGNSLNRPAKIACHIVIQDKPAFSDAPFIPLNFIPAIVYVNVIYAAGAAVEKLPHV